MSSTVLSSSASSDFPWNIIVAILAIVIGSGSITSLYYRNRISKLNLIQNKLREDRRNFYLELLEPYIFLFAKMPTLNQVTRTKEEELDLYNEFLQKIISLEYKRTTFKLSLLGSVDVVKAYNNLTEFTALPNAQEQPDDKQIIILLYATLLLKIHKDLGSKNTLLKHLNEKDILKTMNIRDIDILNIPKVIIRYKQIKNGQMKK